MPSESVVPESGFQRLERLAPLGYFAMGVGWARVAGERMLVIANGSDWTPQPVTLHAENGDRGFGKLPCWFSEDYDHHMGIAVGDLNGNGFDDVVVAVFAGKNQSLSEGGVKVYRGGPNGLDPKPIWLARGFAATGVALAPLCNGYHPDIVVSCLSDAGTIQEPAVDEEGRLAGRPRLLINRVRSDGALLFEEQVINHPAARGAGDVTIADVDLDGQLDLIFAAPKTCVLYGDPRVEDGAPWESCEFWQSTEEHPFSFAAQAFMHPDFPGRQLVASSRGLLSAAQLKGRSLAEIGTGIMIHVPKRGTSSETVQHLAPLDPKKPTVPAGFCVAHDERARPSIVAGFLDARGRDIRGAPLRVFHGGRGRNDLPFESDSGEELPGGGLMAGRVAAAPWVNGPTTISECCLEVGPEPRSVVTLPWRPVGDLLMVRANRADKSPLDVDFVRTSDGTSLCFTPPLPPHSQVSIAVRTAAEIEIVATSSAAWPPAGASGIWRGHLSQPKESCPAADSVRQAG